MHKAWLLYTFLGRSHILGFLMCIEACGQPLPCLSLSCIREYIFTLEKKNQLTSNSCRNKDLREEGGLLWCWTSPWGEKCGFLSEEGLGSVSSSLSLCFAKSQGRWGRHICILEISLVFIWLVLSVNIFFVLSGSIWPSDVLNFEWDSGAQRHTGDPLWLKLGLREPPPPPCTPLPRDQRGQCGRNQVREPWKLLWLFSSPAAHFVFGFAAMYFCKDGSCHLNLCTDTVAQLKKKTVSEQICFYMDLIRNLPGAQFWAWCCQDIEDLWDTQPLTLEGASML